MQNPSLQHYHATRSKARKVKGNVQITYQACQATFSPSSSGSASDPSSDSPSPMVIMSFNLSKARKQPDRVRVQSRKIRTKIDGPAYERPCDLRDAPELLLEVRVQNFRVCKASSMHRYKDTGRWVGIEGLRLLVYNSERPTPEEVYVPVNNAFSALIGKSLTE